MLWVRYLQKERRKHGCPVKSITVANTAVLLRSLLPYRALFSRHLASKLLADIEGLTCKCLKDEKRGRPLEWRKTYRGRLDSLSYLTINLFISPYKHGCPINNANMAVLLRGLSL
jgi:hypothetical protein